MNPFQFSTNDLQLFTLAWFRITGLMFVSPIFGSDTVPPRVKVLFSFVFAIIMFPPSLCQHIFFVVRQHWVFANVLQIAG